MTDSIRQIAGVAAQPPVRQPVAANGSDTAMRAAAQSFEATFLAEMFSHAGLGEARKSNGGGAGEDAFSSLLSREWATSVAANGGFGLADQIYEALSARRGEE